MNFNYKLYIKYILFKTNTIFFKYSLKNNKNTSFFIFKNNLYYIGLHFKLSTLFYSTQLSDMFAYELPVNASLIQTFKNVKNILNLSNTVVVYNFHTINIQQRFFIFTINNISGQIGVNLNNLININSITELFPNSNWLEREISELHGVFFYGKKDLRNLMLQYGDNSLPMLKSYPSIGTREIFYDSITDSLIQNQTTVQF